MPFASSNHSEAARSHAARIPTAFFLIAVLLPSAAHSQQASDIIHLKDGTRITGSIVELIPDTSVSIRSSEGTLYVLDWSRIARIERSSEGAAPPSPSARGFSYGVESWYMYWSLGYSSSAYPTYLQQVVDDIVRIHDPDHTSIAIDMLGFYWPLANERTLLGVIITGPGDRYSYDGRALQINQYIFGGSVMHFFQSIPGDGVFARADAGLAALSSDIHARSLSGVGFKLSGGYGIPVSDEVRILLHAGFSYRSLEDESYSTFSFSVGALF